MGLLDDAIREHLDLKRRRGADPAEIERAEREALGPVRRAPEPQEIDEPDLEQPLPYDDQAGPVAAQGDEPDWHDQFGDERGEFEPFSDEPFSHEPAPESAIEPGFEEPPPPRAAAMPEAPTQHMPLPEPHPEDDSEQPDDAVVPRPHPAAPAPVDQAHSAHPADHGGGETVEYEVEGEFADENAPKDDDVLEETPEFLQDTPDHDRLWFEQRPPRDFDFDG